MKLRTLLDFILRPIPAGETPEAVRSRRTGDYVVAGIFGVVVLTGLFWGLHTQMTTPLGDFVGRPPQSDETQERKRDAVEVELTFTPGAEPVDDGVIREPDIPPPPLVPRDPGVDLSASVSAKIQDEVRTYSADLRTRMDADLRTQGAALTRDLPLPSLGELPPLAPPVTPPPPAPEPPAAK